MKRSDMFMLACVIAVAATAIHWAVRLDAQQASAEPVRMRPVLVCPEPPKGAELDLSLPCNQGMQVEQAGQPRANQAEHRDSLAGVGCGTENECDQLFERIMGQLADTLRSDMQVVVARMNSGDHPLDFAENVCSSLEIVAWWREMPAWAVGNGKFAIIDSVGYSQYADRAAILADTVSQRALVTLGELVRLQTNWGCTTNTTEAMNLSRELIRERRIPLSQVDIGLGKLFQNGYPVKNKAS